MTNGTRNAAPPRSKGYVDPIGLFVLLFAGLNLNGAFLMFLGTEGFLSPVVLLLTLYLCVKYGRMDKVTDVYALFISTVLSYLAFAFTAGIAGSSNESGYLTSYTATVVLVSALYFWLVSVDGSVMRKVLVAYKYALLGSCLLIVFSDALRPFQPTPAVDETKLMEVLDIIPMAEITVRASGLFGNPNEAAMVALYCVVLIATVPSKSAYFRALQFALAVAALLMTFSKAGMLTLLVLVTVFLVTRRSFTTLFLTVLGVAIGFSALWFIFERDLLNLTTEQRERIADVINLATGDINERSTTGRNLLVEYGWEKIKVTFPWGSGLGQFHAMEGGVRRVDGWFELDEWLGIHNTYLMILGEAGLFPLLVFITFLACILVRGSRAAYRDIIVGFTIVLMADMAVSHHVLLLRFANVAFAFVLVLTVVSERAARRNAVPFDLRPIGPRPAELSTAGRPGLLMSRAKF